MVILVTNITDESLNDKTIKKSFDISETYTGKRDIEKIIFLKPEAEKKLWKLNIESQIEEYKIAMDDKISDIYEEIANVIDPLFNKRDYIQVIVDSTILGFYILDVLKKFNIKEVFIAKGGELDKFKTCICEIE